jgi:hypothetical protein
MRDLIKRSSAALSVLLAGIAVEIVLAFARKEPLNIERFGTLVLVIVVMLVAIEVGIKRELSWRTIVSGGLFAIGVVAVTVGVTLLLNPSLVENSTLVNVVGTTIISSGVIVFISGLFVRRQRGVFTPEDRTEYRNREGGQPRALGGPHAIELHTFGDASQAIIDLCRAELSTRDLHYIAYYYDDKCVFYAHVLNNPVLADKIGNISVERRRKRYEAYGRLAHSMVARLDGTFEEVRQGELVRMVLDVRQGAFYHCRVDPYSYFFGVTLDQARVDDADLKVRRVAAAAERASGQIPNPLLPGDVSHDLPAAMAADNVVAITPPKHEPTAG